VAGDEIDNYVEGFTHAPTWERRKSGRKRKKMVMGGGALEALEGKERGSDFRRGKCLTGGGI